MKKLKGLFALILALAVCLSFSTCAFALEETADIAGTYTFTESALGGAFEVIWTLVLNEDGTFTLSTENPAAGNAEYSGTEYSYEDGVLTTGALDFGDSGEPEADFFEDDYTCLWVINDDGTVTPVNYSEEETEDLDSVDFSNVTLEGDVDPEDAIGNTYTYDEENETYGFTTTWELTFISDTECTLYEPNDLMGDTTYTCTYTFDSNQYTITIVSSDTGEMSLSSMFDENYTVVVCVWGAGDWKPANSSSDSSSIISTSSEGSSDADYPAVAYASNSDAQVMDIYIPENATGSDPVIVVVHGGGFKFGSQTMDIIQPVIAAGLENGYVVASVDYRKSGEATFPGALADVKAAVRYLKANAETYGIDADKIVIWGESAGAYLSLMTALTPDVADLDGDVTDNSEYTSSVAALVDFYGPVEFYTMDDEYLALGIEGTTYSEDSSFESAFLGQAIGEDEEFTYTTWWGTYVDQLAEDFTLSAWIQAGTSDTSVPYTQSENFAAALAEVIGEDNVSFSLIDGAEHEDDAFYTDENLAEVFAFLAEVLG